MAGTVKTLLSPVATGALLYTLTRGPANIREPLLQKLSEHLSPATIARGITALKWIVGLGIAKIANSYLSAWAFNNFRLRSEASKYDWPNEIAVVTGGASGFGRLITLGLASHGVKVIALDLPESLPADMLSEIKSKNLKVLYFQCNVTDAATVSSVADRIKLEHGNPSILVNNAGIALQDPIIECKPGDLQRIFGVNIISHYYTLQAFLPHMIRTHKGHVVTIASMASFVTAPTLVPYSNTKAAALTMNEGLMQELRTVHNAPEVKTTVVHPTWAATPMVNPDADRLRRMRQKIIAPEVVADRVVRQVLSGRSAQLVIAPGTEFTSVMKALPHWVSLSLMRLLPFKAEPKEGRVVG